MPLVKRYSIFYFLLFVIISLNLNNKYIHNVQKGKTIKKYRGKKSPYCTCFLSVQFCSTKEVTTIIKLLFPSRDFLVHICKQNWYMFFPPLLQKCNIQLSMLLFSHKLFLEIFLHQYIKCFPNSFPPPYSRTSYECIRIYLTCAQMVGI